MIIKKMTARFGKLSGESLELKDGLNIISAPNESGKSTWSAFIRCMLYGIDTSKRGSAGVLPDKRQFSPWSGLLPEGSMELEREGEEITLRRKSQSKTALFRDFSAVYTGTENLYPLSGLSAGETLIGVSAEVFEKSAFIGQGRATVENSPELESRIAAIVSTGEEQISYSDIDTTLAKWQRLRRHNKSSGAIPELEEQIFDLSQKLSVLESLNQKRTAAALRVQELELLRAELEIHASAQERAEIDDRQSLEKSLENAEEKEREARLSLDEAYFGLRDPREVSLEAARVKAQCEGLEKTGAAKYSHRGVILPAALAILALALVFLDFVSIFVAIIPSIFCAVVALLSWLNATRIRKIARDAMAEYRAILRPYGVDSPEALDALAASHRALYAEHKAALDTLALARRRVSELRINAASSAGESALSGANARLAAAREELAQISGRMEAMGDPALMETERLRLEKSLSENRAQLQELELARELLKKADAQRQARFAPQLTKRTSEIFARLTEGRYDKIALDRQLHLAAKPQGEVLPQDSAYLSEGAKTLLYIALRIAICELCLPNDAKGCPLVLDDALCTLDDARMGLVLDFLRELSQERQVILFTCQRREADCMRGKAGVYILEEQF